MDLEFHKIKLLEKKQNFLEIYKSDIFKMKLFEIFNYVSEYINGKTFRILFALFSSINFFLQKLNLNKY